MTMKEMKHFKETNITKLQLERHARYNSLRVSEPQLTVTMEYI